MNKFVGYMNLGLLILILIALGVGGVSLEQRSTVLAMVVMLVPMVLTMFSMEAEPRFLRAALLTNAVVILLYLLGTGLAGKQAGGAGSLFLAPFLINIAALVRIWRRVQVQKQEEQYAS